MKKRILKGLAICIAVLALAAAALVGWLTATEYRPGDVEALEVWAEGAPARPAEGDRLTILSLNTGYAGLGADSDFFMDGGKSVSPTRAQTERNLAGIASWLEAQEADVWFLQEVDTDSARSGSVDQSAVYRERFGDGSGAYALNFSCNFVPYPLPPIGKVHSGVQTLSSFPIAGAQRIALPSPFRWPVSAANLKRCLLASYIPLEGSDRQLVLVNLHLEAYDDGGGKAAQTEQLLALLTAEYERGNYVIAGGDFNQTFPGALERYPVKNAEYFVPGLLEEESLPQGWQFACGLEVPSSRLLNEPYDPSSEETQYYVIDGFLLSPNVRLEDVETLDLRFAYTDHNPVRLQVILEAA